MFITSQYRQHASHTLASRAYGPQPHMRLLSGLVVDIFRKMLEYYKDMHSRIVVNDHFLVLGWTDKSLFVINELLAMLEGQTVPAPSTPQHIDYPPGKWP